MKVIYWAGKNSKLTPEVIARIYYAVIWAGVQAYTKPWTPDIPYPTTRKGERN